jgi:hypothetical protein
MAAGATAALAAAAARSNFRRSMAIGGILAKGCVRRSPRTIRDEAQFTLPGLRQGSEAIGPLTWIPHPADASALHRYVGHGRLPRLLDHLCRLRQRELQVQEMDSRRVIEDQADCVLAGPLCMLPPRFSRGGRARAERYAAHPEEGSS